MSVHFYIVLVQHWIWIRRILDFSKRKTTFGQCFMHLDRYRILWYHIQININIFSVNYLNWNINFGTDFVYIYYFLVSWIIPINHLFIHFLCAPKPFPFYNSCQLKITYSPTLINHLFYMSGCINKYPLSKKKKKTLITSTENIH